MSTGTIFRLTLFTFFAILSVVTLVQSQICTQEVTKVMPVKRNGRFEETTVKTTVKVCCDGYTIDKNNPKQCVPNCNDDFVLENGVCIPRCDNCKNGECMAPGECKCNDGYIESNDGCSPICDECKNAVCVEPGVCQCNKGFVSSPDGCVPECYNCEHGFCLQPNICQCENGYKFEINHFKCIPNCPEACSNGFCSAPNECTCFKGYQKLSINEHVCVRRTEKAPGDDDDKNDRDADASQIGIADTPEGPEVEGFFKYLGKKIHFIGQFEDIVDA